MELKKDRWNEALRKIRPEIKCLHYKGNVELLQSKMPKLAIVGSRRMTGYGEKMIGKWVPELVGKGVTIVSGFMYGVDQAAHKICIENGGKTIAVLGWGIDREPAGEDEKLYRKILEVDSLILSEYEGELAGEKWTFPERNRIVAGISDAVLVIEAAERSGSLITARLARKFDKPLMALPGRADVSVSEGTNNLIKKGKAVMVTDSNEVLAVMGIKGNEYQKHRTQDPVMLILENGEKTLDELCRILKLPADEMGRQLTILSLRGEVAEKAGKYTKMG